VLAAALRLGCDQALLKRGVVEAHAPAQTAGGEDGLHGLFGTIRGILSLSDVGGSAPMPRAWSNYLAAASAQLKPVVQGENYNRAASQLHKISRQLAPGFQDRLNLVDSDRLGAIAQQVRKLETLLPSLIISVTLLELYFRPADNCASARPASSTPVAETIPEMGPARPATYQPVPGLSGAIACAA